MRFPRARVQAVPPWPIEAPPYPDASAVCDGRRRQLSGHSHGVTGNTGNRFAPSPWAHSYPPPGPTPALKNPATTCPGPPVPLGPGLTLPLPRRATSAAPPSTDYPAWSRLRVSGQDCQRRPPVESRTPLSSLPPSRLQPWHAPRQTSPPSPAPSNPWTHHLATEIGQKQRTFQPHHPPNSHNIQ